MTADARNTLCTSGLTDGLAAALLAGMPSRATESPDAPTTQGRRPNIVFVLIDDFGFSDFGAYGSQIATPNIDSLAKSGARFTNFHTASTCEATRVRLQSGVRQPPSP